MSIDHLGTMALGVLVGIVVGLVGGADALPEEPDAAFDLASGLGVYFLYYVGFEHLFGATPGKWITGTRVVTEDGRRPRLGQIVGRTAARLMPFEAFSFLGSGLPTGWHDHVSRTCVVRRR